MLFIGWLSVGFFHQSCADQGVYYLLYRASGRVYVRGLGDRCSGTSGTNGTSGTSGTNGTNGTSGTLTHSHGLAFFVHEVDNLYDVQVILV
jgi:hypothetical protein